MMSLLVAAIVSLVSSQDDSGPLHLSIANLQSAPIRFILYPVEICGKEGRDDEGKRVLTEERDGETRGVYIAEDLKLTRRRTNDVCFAGMWERTDGKTLEQVAKEPQSSLRSAYDPHYVLKPLWTGSRK